MSFTIEAKEKHLIRRTNLPRFRHLDFATLPGKMAFRQDSGSQIIRQHRDTPISVDEETQFHSKEYATATVEEQLFLDPSTNQRRTRAQLLAAAISKKISAPRRILDIGCSHGTLLTELSKLFPSSELHGMDVNPDFQPTLSKASITFHDSLDGINITFDLVTSSHALMYLPSMTELERQLRMITRPGSVIVLAVPDYAVNPTQLLLGDQHHYFNEASLREVCAPMGEVEIIRLNSMPHELLGIIRCAIPGPLQTITDSRDIFEMALENLQDSTGRIRDIKENTAVLGTTTVAAFADETLIQGAELFVDEHRSQRTFRNRPVCHPRDLPKHLPLLIGYAARNLAIQQRLKTEYRINNILMV